MPGPLLVLDEAGFETNGLGLRVVCGGHTEAFGRKGVMVKLWIALDPLWDVGLKNPRSPPAAPGPSRYFARGFFIT